MAARADREKLETQIKSNPDVRICAVDLNVNDALAVCTILGADGTVIAIRFIRDGPVCPVRQARFARP